MDTTEDMEMDMMMVLLGSSCSLLLLEIEEEEEKREKRQQKRRSREWVKSWRLRRETLGSHRFLINELRLEDELAYRGYLRMDENCFLEILNVIKPKVQKQNTIMRLCIPPEEVLTLVLRFLATGETFRSLEFQTRLSLAFISLTVPYVCSVIYTELMHKYLQFPSTANEWEEVANGFNTLWQFPLCIGALDGKHIAFRASKKDGAWYRNYKGFDSIVLMALADARYKFIFVDIGRNGRVSDGGVLNRSKLRKFLLCADRYLPSDTIIGNNRCLPYTIVADDAFPLEKHIMKPYPYNSVEKEKKIYNFRLSHARQAVEHSFGILSNRFRVFQTNIHLSANKVILITQAACVLHNFLIDKSAGYVSGLAPQKANSSNDAVGRANNCGQVIRNHSRAANQIRKSFAEYFSGEGELPWQDEYI